MTCEATTIFLFSWVNVFINWLAVRVNGVDATYVWVKAWFTTMCSFPCDTLDIPLSRVFAFPIYILTGRLSLCATKLTQTKVICVNALLLGHKWHERWKWNNLQTRQNGSSILNITASWSNSCTKYYQLQILHLYYLILVRGSLLTNIFKWQNILTTFLNLVMALKVSNKTFSVMVQHDKICLLQLQDKQLSSELSAISLADMLTLHWK